MEIETVLAALGASALVHWHSNNLEVGPKPKSWVLSTTDGQLEERHDWIQWAFPLAQPSRAVPGSPVLGPRDLAWFAAEGRLRDSLRDLCGRFTDFLGPWEAGADADPAWARGADHNQLRITRAIRSLACLGLEEEAAALRDRVLSMTAGRGAAPVKAARRHWKTAVADGRADRLLLLAALAADPAWAHDGARHV